MADLQTILFRAALQIKKRPPPSTVPEDMIPNGGQSSSGVAKPINDWFPDILNTLVMSLDKTR